MISKKHQPIKKRYSQISLKKRQVLVDSVIDLRHSITNVAKKLRIKLSTAKLILNKYKKTGTLFNKRLKNAKKLLENNQINSQPQLGSLVIPTVQIQQGFIEAGQQEFGSLHLSMSIESIERWSMLNYFLHQQWLWSCIGFYQGVEFQKIYGVEQLQNQ